ncbi:methyltransferase family protein [Celeribacter litoreus]|uniref:methyltransferase family protein n=1 Tax=Celeribacter litoreus TaxID=2876714 RepID=UPI001CCA543A|nr:isoprenylcysteine carboxylmethyltransferase family protein [Celeribacter litoreus]MCA0045235.1 isoprenylcysteine carboxylmethyltransferase family protein [Celeribacter litoreus]
MAVTYLFARFGIEIATPFFVQLIGCAIILIGLCLMILAVYAMWRHRTTVIPHRVPTSIVTDGVYRFTRNPIYLGDVFTLGGVALLCGSPIGVVLIPVFMIVIERRFIREEENWLRTEFREEFQTWAAHTRRWL